eukprot:TRINITY_DN19249_c0_g1_i1.p1 TRINITY_DN19249_c0_g1~~TRINITY_DN19249_c0_g1_i1.p1  ORF type:complete len:791 (+),score=144.85 TRINITY_DN19249_c0_g1_i1:92-2464(+)
MLSPENIDGEGAVASALERLHLAASPSLLDGRLRLGIRVQVLPGRQFPSFAAGDIGVVHRVDEEARTCDVLFDHRTADGPVPVALRHLGLLGEVDSWHGGEMTRAHVHQSNGSKSLMANALGEELGVARQAVDAKEQRSCLEELEVRLASQQQTLIAMEARVAACEAAMTVAEAHAGVARPAGRLVAARVAALEGAHQAEVAELRRALTEAVATGREHEQLHRRHKTSGRGLEQQFEDLDERCGRLRQTILGLRAELEQLAGAVSDKEQRAASLSDVVSSASNGLSRLSELLEGQERRTSDLGQALSSAGQDLVRLNGRLEETGQRLAEQTRQQDSSIFTGRSERLSDLERKDTDSIWRALRDLQELVVHESEHRAAGLREVLGVIGQGTEQLRSDHARLQNDMEVHWKAESRKIKQHISESQARFLEHDRCNERLDERLEALANALAGERGVRVQEIAKLEEQVREMRFEGLANGPLPTAIDAASVKAFASSSSPSGCRLGASPREDSTPAQMVTSQSLQRLEALEARFDHGKSAQNVNDVEGDIQDVRRSPLTATEDTLGKLRGQLEGLRSELQANGGGNSSQLTPAESSAVQAPRLLEGTSTETRSPRLAVPAPPWRQPPAVQTRRLEHMRVKTVPLQQPQSTQTMVERRIIYPVPAPEAATATVGIDLNKDSKADIPVSGSDLDNDSILQQGGLIGIDLNHDGLGGGYHSLPSQGSRVMLSTGPAKGYSRPLEYGISEQVPVGSSLGPEIAVVRATSCPQCGNIYAADSIFCRQCGLKREEDTVPG